MNKVITSEKAPAAIGPYSQAIDAKGTLYVSGQLPFKEGTLVSEDSGEQTAQSLENIYHIITEAGYQKKDIVKCVVFLKDMDNFSKMNDAYTTFFGEHKPARVAVEVARLPKDVQVEVDAICVK